jgi:hypothetical protein
MGINARELIGLPLILAADTPVRLCDVTSDGKVCCSDPMQY